MKSLISAIALAICLSCVSTASAEHYVYKAQCITSQPEDIARTIQGNIYLALRDDNTVSKSNIVVKVKKLPEPKVWVNETALLDGLGYSFNPTDLSISLGGVADGHACIIKGLVTISVSVTRKNGTTQSNSVSTTIDIHGNYATSTKVKQSQLP